MIAVCPNKECNQRYRIQTEMIGRIAKCKRCNNRFKIEELISSPKPPEHKPVENEYSEPTAKHDSNKKSEPKTPLPSPVAKSPYAPLNKGAKKSLYRAISLFVILILGISALLFIGNFHIIRNSQEGPSVVQRDSFGFSEFFINADTIMRIPRALAETQFPLGLKVLQREGIIKPEEVSKKQMSNEEKKEWDKALRDAQKEIDKIKQDAQKASKASP
jgi:uncharacterized membrane protein